MIDSKIYTIVNQLIANASGKKKRKIVNTLANDISKKPPIKVLRGLRGIGKTTALS
jgi:predicted AAA+ superfamily ATPase